MLSCSAKTLQFLHSLRVWSFPVATNELILFPSWLSHQVRVNEKATTDRISISFNTFVRGTFGSRKDLTELILK